MRRLGAWAAAIALVFAAASPAQAQFFFGSSWSLVKAGQARKVAKDLTVTASEDWSRSNQRPTGNIEVWSRDGASLNELTFFARIDPGKPLFKEADKKMAPLPKFKAGMLPTDLVEMFEDTGRIVTGSSLFETTQVRAATLAGQQGVEFDYRYASEGDNLWRMGTGRAAVLKGKLYLITFEAPQIHYYAEGIARARAVMDSARVGAK